MLATSTVIVQPRAMILIILSVIILALMAEMPETVNCRGSAFEILVSDNGRGFDASQGESNSPGSSAGFGNGLTNMRRRLTEVGGTFQLESRPGQGTTIRFGLSLNGSVR